MCARTFNQKIVWLPEEGFPGWRTKTEPKTDGHSFFLHIRERGKGIGDASYLKSTVKYTVGRCGEQFCDQDLLSGPLCCQKLLDSTPKSVQLYALPNLICSSEPIFLHSNQNQDRFPNPLIEGFQGVNLKISHYLTILAFIAGLSDSLLSGWKHEITIGNG